MAARKAPPPPPPPPSDPMVGLRGSVTSDASDTPPKRTPPPKPEPEPKPSGGRKPPKQPLQRKLEEFLVIPALAYQAAGHPYPAEVITQRSPDLAESLYELSRTSAPVKRVLERMVSGGAWGGVLFSSASIAVPLLQYHGVIPGADPFMALYGEPSSSRGPIVPPPPDASPSQDNGGGWHDGDMSPPLGDNQPPGVVTVAGTNDNSTTVPD